MSGKLIFAHGPHKGTEAICQSVGINESIHTKLRCGIIPTYVGKSQHYLLEGVVPIIKGYGYTNNAPIVIKGNCQYAYYARSNLARKMALRSKIVNQKKVHVLAVSDMNKKDYLQLGFNNVKTCEGFMYRDIEELLKLCPENNNFLFIGQNGYLKGLDRAISLFIELKKKNIINKHVKFYVVGNHQTFIENLDIPQLEYEEYKIIFTGTLSNINDLMRICKYQLHLARYEPNAVAVMEGMAAGLIPLVSDATGNASHIRESGFDPVVYYQSDNTFNFDAIQNIVTEVPAGLLKQFSRRYSLLEGQKRWRDSYEALL